MSDVTDSEVQVEKRPIVARRSLSHLPLELIDYFHSRGRSVGLRARNEICGAADEAVGWQRVLVEDYPPDIQMVLKRTFRVENGYCYRGDWVLGERSFEARDEHRAMQQAIKDSIEAPDYTFRGFEGSISDLARSTGHSMGIGIASGTLRSPHEDAIGGPAVIDEGLTPEDVKEAIKSMKNKK